MSDKIYLELDSLREDISLFQDRYHESLGIIKKLEAELAECKAILKDCITTKEDAETWRAEMFSTISEVVGE